MVITAMLLTLFFGAYVHGALPASSGSPKYLDSHLPVADRVSDLLPRMTLEEKVGQMALISVSRLWGNCQGAPGALNQDCLRQVLGDDHVGAILSGGGEAPQPNGPREWAQMTNAIQGYAVSHSTLHIPVLYGTDAVHGDNNVLGATIFPHNIGMAATWDPRLAEDVAARTSRAVRATGVHWTYSPVADIARDLRWGRYYETFGEDPYLASRFVAAEVQGYQGTGFSTGVAATVKHFIGYSEPMNGHDRMFAELPLRYLRQAYYPSFQAGVGRGVATVMADSGSVNGVPVHASAELLTDVLRRQMGFKGFVTSDWQDVDALYTRYHVASSESNAISLAVGAGVDMVMVPYDATGFTRDLRDSVMSGTVSEARIDQAVRRILTLKFQLGLFDHAYVDASKADATVLGADHGLALKAVEESTVLLKNEGHILPLARRPTILVTGRSAASVADQMGGWTIGWQGLSGSEKPPAVTVVDAIRHAMAGQGQVLYAPGSNGARAAEMAKRASEVIVVVGEKPYAEGLGDTQTAALSADDERLLNAVLGTRIPVVVVVLAGRPLMMTDVVRRARAVLMAWLPGTEAGAGISNILFGRYNPAGRLPVSWPRSIGQAPMFYTYLPGTNVRGDHEYDPLFPFGYGLSYTSYSYGTLRVQSPAHPNSSIQVSVVVRNTGHTGGDEVVQIYASAQQSPVLTPAKWLIGFERVHLRAGESRVVTLEIPTARLAIIPGDVLGTAPAVVMPGRYTIQVGNLRSDLTLE
jgi:beta-glucosidase